MFVYVWGFTVREDLIESFEEHYGQGGAWVELFRRGKGYVRTILLRDLENPRRYLTIDFWKDRESYDSFRSEFDIEFARIDALGETFTESEISLGSYFTAD